MNSWGIKVPNDVALIGYDDDRICKVVDPELSSVRIPKNEMGEKAVSMLSERIASDSKEDFRTVVLKPTVVTRRSCGCPYSIIDEDESVIGKSSNKFEHSKTVSVS